MESDMPNNSLSWSTLIPNGAPSVSLETSRTFNMLGILEQKDVASGCHSNNADRYLVLMLLKTTLDTVVLYFCCQKLCTCFLRMCSLSIILADIVMVCLIASMWFLGPERYILSLCYLLANASATYEALPLPMMCLGLLDYCLEDTYLGKQSDLCTFLRNLVLTLVVWILALTYSFGSVTPDLMELNFGTGVMVLVCEVRESTLANYFVLGGFTAVICAMLPFWAMIPQWVKEAERLLEAREKPEKQSSDLLFTLTNQDETKSGEENYLESIQPCPPLWFSLTLGFGIFWMPYLSVSMVCIISGLGVPAYIMVNLLWLECANSLLTGVVFWEKSKSQGPYSRLPENVCSWHVYWHLSKGTRHQQFPIAVFNPSKEKSNTLLCV